MQNNLSNCRVLFNDSEGLSQLDLNNLQEYARAHIVDQIIGSQARYEEDSANPLTSYCYSPNGGGAIPCSTGVAAQFGNRAGLIAQWTSTGPSDSQTPRLLTYWLGANDLLTNLGTNVAGNPRWCGIFVKITNVGGFNIVNRDYINLSGTPSSQTFTKTKTAVLAGDVAFGTPAANPSLPTYSDPTFVPFAYIYQPAGYGGVPLPEHICDARMPMRFASINVFPNDMKIFGNWAHDANGLYAAPSGAATGTDYSLAMFPGGADFRLLRVSVFGDWQVGFGALTTDLIRRQLSTGEAPGVNLTPNPSGTGFSLNAPTSNFSTDLKPSMPVWGNGHVGGPWTSFQGTSAYDSCVAGVRFSSASDKHRVQLVRFFYAY